MICNKKLLIVIAEKHKGDAVMAEAKKHGASGGTILLGRGTADNTLLRLLGLDDVEKELLYTLLPSELVPEIMEALRHAESLRKLRGLMFTLNVLDALHLAQAATNKPSQEYAMSNALPSSDYELITIIVNSGFADQVMDAARHAGATGGTVINARGTAREEDARFFGITIVPEKELVMVLSPRGESQRIMESIRNEFQQAEPGIGIVFRMPVERFEMLGTKK